MKRGTGLTLIGVVLFAVFLMYLILALVSKSNLPSFSPIPQLSPAIQPHLPLGCSNAEISATWESIFLETDSSGITIFTNDTIENSPYCDFYIATKEVSGELYTLMGYEEIQTYVNKSNIDAIKVKLGSTLIDDVNDNASFYINDEYGEYYYIEYIKDIKSSQYRPLPGIISTQAAHTEFSNIFNINSIELNVDDWYVIGEDIDIFRFNNYESNIIEEGKVNPIYPFSSYNFKFNNNSGIVGPCTQNWRAINDTCKSNERFNQYYDDNNFCQNNTGMPTNLTFDCDYEGNGIIGNITELPTTNINPNVQVNDSLLNLSLSYTNTQNIEILDSGKTIIEFNWNFSSNPFNLRNISITKQPSSSDIGYLIANKISSTKTFYVSRILNSSRVCVKNAEVSSISSISDDCDETNEFLLNCPGTNSSFSCSIPSTNDTYIITGLTNSGVVEYNPADSCIPTWVYSNWTECNEFTTNQSRVARDVTGCLANITQTQNCSIFVPLPTCSTNWNCTQFEPTKCQKNETQLRTCTDYNYCNSTNDRPSSSQICDYKSNNIFFLIIIIVSIIVLIIIIIIIIFIVLGNQNSKFEQVNDPYK